MDAKKLAAELDALIGENADQMGIVGYLDTGIPELNYAISGSYSGGFPVGRLVEIFGPASCGKTFLATMMMIAAQKKGGIAGFSDHERSFEPVLAKGLGLSLERHQFKYIRPKTFEESIDTAVKFCEGVREKGLIDPDAPLIWVFDSVASMIPHDKLYNDKGERREIGDYNMRDTLLLAKSCSQSYPTLSQFAEDYNMTVLLLNQIRTKPGVMYGNPETTPGGNAAEFYCSVRLNIGKSEITNGKPGKDKEVLGFEIQSTAVKNKVARPFRKAKWQVRFNEGLGVTIDQIATNVDFLVRQGVIEKDNRYCVWEGKKVFQSVLIDQLKADPQGHEKLMALVAGKEPDETE